MSYLSIHLSAVGGVLEVVSFCGCTGYGKDGTVVFAGSLGGRDVAVKRMLLEFFDVTDREIQILIQSDAHPNVVRYFAKVLTS